MPIDYQKLAEQARKNIAGQTTTTAEILPIVSQERYSILAKQAKQNIIARKQMPEIEIEKEKETGFVQSVVQDLAKPFLMAGVAVESVAAEIIPNLFNVGVSKLRGDKQAEDRYWKNIDKELDKPPTEFGYFGEVGRAETYGEVAGAGVETLAWAIPGTKLAKLNTLIKASKVAVPVQKVVKVLTPSGIRAFSTGYSFGAGRSLREGKSLKEANKDGLITGVVSFGFNNIINGAISSSKKILKVRLKTETPTKTEFKKAMEKFGAEATEKMKPKTVILTKKKAETNLTKMIKESFDIKGLKMTPAQVTALLGGLTAFTPITLGQAIPARVAIWGLRAMNTQAGKEAVMVGLRGISKQLIRLDPIVRQRMAPLLIAKFLDEIIWTLNKEAK